MSRITESLLETSAVIMAEGGIDAYDPNNARQIFEAWRKASPHHWRRLAALSGLPTVPPIHQRRFLEELEVRVSR